MFLATPIPCAELQKLEFLLGQFRGLQVLYLPDQPPIRFEVHSVGAWETSERYMRLETFCRASNAQYDSILSMIGYDVAREQYRLWLFSRVETEPITMSGGFEGDAFVLVGDALPLSWGMQRLKYTFTMANDDGYDVLGEYWTLDGWRQCFTLRMERLAS